MHAHYLHEHTHPYVIEFGFRWFFFSFRWKEQYLCNWHKIIDGIWETYSIKAILFDFTSRFFISCTIEFLDSNHRTIEKLMFQRMFFSSLVKKENTVRIRYLCEKKSFQQHKICPNSITTELYIVFLSFCASNWPPSCQLPMNWYNAVIIDKFI